MCTSANFGISHDEILTGIVGNCAEGFLRMKNSNFVEKSCVLDWIVVVIALLTFCDERPMPAMETSTFDRMLKSSFANGFEMKLDMDAKSSKALARGRGHQLHWGQPFPTIGLGSAELGVSKLVEIISWYPVNFCTKNNLKFFSKLLIDYGFEEWNKKNIDCRILQKISYNHWFR